VTFAPSALVIKLTRLNRVPVAINPDAIVWAEASPDTTLCLVGGEKIIVREPLDEVQDLFLGFRRSVAHRESFHAGPNTFTGE
jgi:flagellar protein FlbD